MHTCNTVRPFVRHVKRLRQGRGFVSRGCEVEGGRRGAASGIVLCLADWRRASIFYDRKARRSKSNLAMRVEMAKAGLREIRDDLPFDILRRHA